MISEYSNEQVDILLSVYNGERYLSELLKSLQAQTHRNFNLIVRDDGSVDNSWQIIKNYEAGNKKNTLTIQGENVGPVESFSCALSKSRGNYVMFCDQDDVWFPDKIEKTLKKMQEEEKKTCKETPLLIFTNLCMVNEDLKITGDSYFKYQNIDPSRNSLHCLLTQNVACGCTIMANRSLVKLAGEIPAEAVMHDHWFSLVAAAFGEIFYLNRPTLYYRQHDKNFFGASKYGMNYFYQRYKSGIDRVKKRFYQNVDQAGAFLERYKEMLSSEQIEILKEFSKLQEINWIYKRKTLIKYKIYKSGWRRNIGTILII